jgi:hypothetical protein
MPRRRQFSSGELQLLPHNDLLTATDRVRVHRRARAADNLVAWPTGFVGAREETRRIGALRATSARPPTEADGSDSHETGAIHGAIAPRLAAQRDTHDRCARDARAISTRVLGVCCWLRAEISSGCHMRRARGAIARACG